MTDRLIRDITHVLVVMSSKAVAKRTGILGTLVLCFGPNDEDAITSIYLTKTDSQIGWRLPHLVLANVSTLPPVFKGRVADEILTWGRVAQDAIKKTFGNAEYGHRYRVTWEGKAKDETDSKPQEAAGAH